MRGRIIAARGKRRPWLDVAVDVLLNQVEYDLPDSPSALDMRRLPALPQDGLTLVPVRVYR
ncbi:hypothetical protein [Pigmentiphaga sp. NML080357]|uniref:hypothetical protein n=1 Tax=Pigmentiphaga sp. NML080357 TaxID=2008675 RepID=UPI001E3A155D|nr:hypothetical protein [Pigmentiphaga sp. NML080357]